MMNSDKFYLKLFTRQNVGKQLMSLFFFTILIPVLCAGSIILAISSHQLTQKYEHLAEAEANQIHSVLVTTTLYLHEVYEDLARDKELRELLASDYATARDAEIALNQYEGFGSTMKNAASISEIKLYVDPEILKHDSSFSYYYPVTEKVRQEDWYIHASETRGNFWGTAMRTGSTGLTYWELNYYCHIPIPRLSSYAVLVISVSNDYLRSLIQSSGYQIYLSANEDPVFYSSDRSYPGNRFPIEIDSDTASYTQTGKLSVLGKRTIAAVRTLQPTQSSDYLYILSTNPKALSDIRTVQFSIGLCILFTLMISLLLICLFSQYFSSRIQTLRLAMHKVTNNDYEIVNSIQGDDELSATFQDLKTMVQKLKEKEAQIYEAQLKEQLLSNQQQQMELKLLSNQINPHFLYNALETIRMKAFSEGNREVANAIKLLGKSMRYVLGNTRITAATLDKELEYIRTYLAIQKLRFAERVNYSIEIDPDLDPSRYKILPLLIQPVVENAISHGIEPTGRPGRVDLRLSRSPDGLLIVDVFDDGAGMNAETLQDVVTHLDVPRSESEHGIGLYNINNRIHLYYGKQYGLSIISSPGTGTQVSLVIPLHNLSEDEV